MPAFRQQSTGSHFDTHCDKYVSQNVEIQFKFIVKQDISFRLPLVS